MSTILDFIIDLKPKETIAINPLDRIFNVVYYCTRKVGAPEVAYVEITDKADIATYTDNTAPEELFNEGMYKIYLAFDTYITATEALELNQLAYTIIVESGLTYVEPFDGVISTIIDVTDLTSDALAMAKHQNVFKVVNLNDNTKKIPCSVFGRLFARRSFVGSMQYSQYPAYNNEAKETINSYRILRDKQYSFVGKDATTVIIASLLYLRAGGINLVDIYIREQLRQDIQTNMYLYIGNKESAYSNQEIGALVSIGDRILKRYINDGRINTGSVAIPPREQQTNEDIIIGKVNNLDITAVDAGAIWWLSGFVTNNAGVIL